VSSSCRAALRAGYLAATYTSMLSGPDTTSYLLQVRDGDAPGIYELKFCADVRLADLVPGAPATIMYENIVRGVMSSCRPPLQQHVQTQGQEQQQLNYAPTGRRRALLDMPTIPSSVGFIVYLVTLCGYNRPAEVNPNVGGLMGVYQNMTR
jgi:hypothetical protein